MNDIFTDEAIENKETKKKMSRILPLKQKMKLKNLIQKMEMAGLSFIKFVK